MQHDDLIKGAGLDECERERRGIDTPVPTGIPGFSDPAAFVTVTDTSVPAADSDKRVFVRLTDEALDTQLGHNSNRKHDSLERMAFVRMELELSIK